MVRRPAGAGRAPFLAAAALLAIAHVVVAVPGFTLTRFWEDEAYNLTVPLHLIAGEGYSSAGFLTTLDADPFDVRISTGPVVLLPIAGVLATGVDPVIGARAVMLVFYAALVGALFLAGRRIAGPWGGLLAASGPLMLDATDSFSPLQGPTDVLGEVPSAFLLVAAMLTLRRPAWSGLLFGLALQAKTLSVLSGPALVVAVALAAGAGAASTARLRRVLVFALAAAVPTVVYELAKLLALGPGAYVVSTRQWLRFLLTGGQEGFSVSPGEKVVALITGWHVPWPLVLVLLAAGAALAVSTLLRVLRGHRLRAELVPLAAAVAGVLLTWCAWWVLSTKDPLWLRHPAPGLLATVPLVLAFVLRAARARTGSGVPRVIATGVPALLTLAAVLAAVLHGIAAYQQGVETLPDQRRAAAAAEDFPGDALLARWGPAISIVVLSGKEIAHPDEPVESAWVIEMLDRTPRGMALQERRVEALCGADREAVAGYMLCEPGQRRP
ncbi:hypothetical protein [Naasia sp. SYSU D00948]|uniref:hypothetical protein n=1 Tax=Naasia sp. SYSU D00948 TaxID=2817379 RepID=UPI001B3008AF|nr:hypothetical protein [Naasia sp. SYSU D00948]